MTQKRLMRWCTECLAATVLSVASRGGSGRSDAAGAAACGRTRSSQSTAHHDDDGVGRRRGDSEQVHDGRGNGGGVAGAEVVAGAAGTQSFVLLMHDPEPVLAKGSKMDITHWLIWNIPGTSTGLAEGVAAGELPDGSRQVSLRANAYMGPGAPAGPYHHYTFELYALDTKLEVPQGTPQEAAATRTAVVNAMDGHVLGKAVLVARFHR